MDGKTWQEIALLLGPAPTTLKITRTDKDLDGIIIYALSIGILGGAVGGSFIGSFINETYGKILGLFIGVIVALAIIFILGFLGRTIFDGDGLIYGIMSGTGIIFVIDILGIPGGINEGIKGMINGAIIGGLSAIAGSVFIILILANKERL